jgi:hypothetical protein
MNLRERALCACVVACLPLASAGCIGALADLEDAAKPSAKAESPMDMPISERDWRTIDLLHDEVETGALSADDFASDLNALLESGENDVLTADFLGGVLDGLPLDQVASLLGLDEEQAAQLALIAQGLASDSRELRQLARAQVRALLVSQQAAAIDALAGQTLNRLGIQDDTGMVAELLSAALTKRIGLAPRQSELIDEIGGQLGLDLAQLRELARGDFTSLLSSDQSALLDLLGQLPSDAGDGN